MITIWLKCKKNKQANTKPWNFSSLLLCCAAYPWLSSDPWWPYEWGTSTVPCPQQPAQLLQTRPVLLSGSACLTIGLPLCLLPSNFPALFPFLRTAFSWRAGVGQLRGSHVCLQWYSSPLATPLRSPLSFLHSEVELIVRELEWITF